VTELCVSEKRIGLTRERAKMPSSCALKKGRPKTTKNGEINLTWNVRYPYHNNNKGKEKRKEVGKKAHVGFLRH